MDKFKEFVEDYFEELERIRIEDEEEYDGWLDDGGEDYGEGE